jgi:hypothetical protein
MSIIERIKLGLVSIRCVFSFVENCGVLSSKEATKLSPLGGFQNIDYWGYK